MLSPKTQKMNLNKVVIKNFKGVPTMSKTLFDDEWKKLKEGVCAVYTSRALEYSLEELNRTVENLCTYKHGPFLYENLYEITEMHLKNELLPSISKQIDFLGTMNYAWVTFCQQINLIKSIFLYLDRTYLLDNLCLLSIWNMSLSVFKKNIVLNGLLRQKLIDGLLYLIDQERQGVVVDKNLLKSLINMLTTLQVYDIIFAVPFIYATEILYKTEGRNLIRDNNIVKYLRHVDRRLTEEQDRVINYLNSYTGTALQDVLVNQLLMPHLKTILNLGVWELIEKNILKETALLYKLLGLFPSGRKELLMAFSEYLKKTGRLIVIDPENDKNMIQDLIDFKDKIDIIVTKCFSSNLKFSEAVRESFKFFINQRHNKPSELLAKFVDDKMRSKNRTEDEIEKILQKVMILFRFVQGKDVFEAFYKRYMAKRLLVGKSTSQDAENSMISKLKIECGGGFTSKFEGMFKDITVSQGINSAFRQHLNHINNTGEGDTNLTIDMCINILTTSYWPNYPTYDLNLPQEMALCQNIFLQFYMENHNGRKLIWQPNLGHCIVKANFTNGKKELQVSLFQTIVLLLFNNNNEVSYKDVQETINLEANEMKRTLQSLACGKSRVLQKKPKGKDINDTDSFVFNNEFVDKLFRVKINQVQMKETVEEQRATEESVIQDRQFQIDAAIVRIMKQHKSMSHNMLITRLYQMLDIPVNPADFKKRIEQLISTEYIERDDCNSTVYKYIA